MITVGDAVLKIIGDTSGVDKSLGDLKNKLSDTKTGVFGLAGAFKGLLPALSVAAVVGGLTDIISKTMQLGEELENMSIRTGIGVEALQRLGNAAKMGGGSLQSLESIIRLMQSSIGNSDKAFARLRINLEDLQKLSPDKQFIAIATAIEALPDVSERVAAYRDIFGRAGTEVAVYVQNLKEAGTLPIMTEEQVKQAAEANKSFEKMGISWSNMLNMFAITILPNLQPLVDVLTFIIQKYGELITLINSAPQPVKFWLQGGITNPFAVMDLIKSIPTIGIKTPPKTAAGGIAMSPQIRMVGEAGPEAIIPLNQMGNMSTNLTINVGSFMGDDMSLRQFTRKISDILTQETKRSLNPASKTSYYSSAGHL